MTTPPIFEDLDLCPTEDNFINSNNLVLPVYLGKEFYTGTRDELTPIKLKSLAALASSIPIPTPWGSFLDETHYAKTLELMLASTAETRHRGVFFYRKILPLLHHKGSLLDIGPGNGQLTSWVGNKFKHITVIDISKKVIETFNVGKKLFRSHLHIHKILGSLLDIQLPANFYDLSILSHVLYYIERKQWLETINSAYEATKSGGIIVITLSGDQFGKADLIKYFGGKSIDIDELAQECAQLFGLHNTKMFASKETIITQDLSSMLHIAGFFLYDAHITASDTALAKYLVDAHKQSDGCFLMSTQQKFILVFKK